MSNHQVLILYPEQFACRSKFLRKVDAILSRLDAYQILLLNDSQGFAEDLEKRPHCAGVTTSHSLEDATHAIVFDDGEVFPSELKLLTDRNVVCRVVPIAVTRVINIHREKNFASKRSLPNYEYIGRGSSWGNPYSMFDGDGEGLDSRDEVIRKFRYDFERNLLRRSKDDALRLAGKRLGCFCKPAACHGDVIAEYLNAYDDNT